MPEPTNAQRATKAARALDAWRGPYTEDEADIQDLISDLLHLAAKRRQRGLSRVVICDPLLEVGGKADVLAVGKILTADQVDVEHEASVSVLW